MKKKQDLFHLIQSMTKAEKRYFKLYASKHVEKGRSNSVKLFDAIEAQTEYDEAAIRRRFAKERFSRQLAVQKNYLYTLILRSLRAFHAGTSVGVRVAELLHAVEVLSDRGLYAQCSDLLARALQLARRHEEFALELRVLAYERHIAYELGNDARRDAVSGDQQAVLRKLSNLVECDRLAHEVANAPVAGDSEEQRRGMLECEFLADESRALSLRALVRLHNARMNHYIHAGDHVRCRAAAARILEVIERFGEIPPDLEHHILLCHYIPMYGALMAGDLAVIDVLLERLGRIRVRTQYAGAYHRILLHQFALIVELRRGNFTAALALAPRVEAILRDRAPGVRTFMILWMHAELARLYFAIGDLARSFQHTNSMLEVPTNEALPQSGVEARFHIVVLHLEQGNMANVEYAVHGARRFLARIHDMSAAGGLLLTYLRRLAGAASAHEVVAETERFLRVLERKGVGVPELQRYMIVDVNAWIESRRTQTAYADAFRALRERATPEQPIARSAAA